MYASTLATSTRRTRPDAVYRSTEVSRRGMAGAELRCCQSPGICPNARPAIPKAVTDRRPA